MLAWLQCYMSILLVELREQKHLVSELLDGLTSNGWLRRAMKFWLNAHLF
jgi:hypothetical protein